MKVPKALLLVVAVLAVLALLPASQAADPQAGYNSFYTRCGFDITRMVKQVDPGLFPGVNPTGHQHHWAGWIGGFFFVANTTLPAGSTSDPGYAPRSSTCRQYADWPIYYNPEAIVAGLHIAGPDVAGGRMVASTWWLNTYRSPAGKTVNPIPYAAVMVVGHSSARAVAEEDSHITWTCGDIEGGSRRPIDCTGNGVVTAVAVYPDCWDGQHGWGADGWDGSFSGKVQYDTTAGISPINFTYSTDGNCPDGYKLISQLVTREHFTDPRQPGNPPLVDPFNDQDQIVLSFSCGSFACYHGDFINTWGKTLFLPLTNKCNNLQTFRLSDSYDCLEGLK